MNVIYPDDPLISHSNEYPAVDVEVLHDTLRLAECYGGFLSA